MLNKLDNEIRPNLLGYPKGGGADALQMADNALLVALTGRELSTVMPSPKHAGTSSSSAGFPADKAAEAAPARLKPIRPFQANPADWRRGAPIRGVPLLVLSELRHLRASGRQHG